MKQTFAKQLRGQMTDAEHLLWHHLRAHRLDGGKFRRQQAIGPYIVDFVNQRARLIVEADGSQHLNASSDDVRDAWLRAKGYRILRFWNNQILGDTEAVLEKIQFELHAAAPLSPTPLPQGERDF